MDPKEEGKKLLGRLQNVLLEKNGENQMDEQVTNEEVLRKKEEKRTIISIIRQRKANWVGHMLGRHCIIREVIEGNIEGKKSLGKRKLEVLDDFRSLYWELKNEAQEREPWRKVFAIFH